MAEKEHLEKKRRDEKATFDTKEAQYLEEISLLQNELRTKTELPTPVSNPNPLRLQLASPHQSPRRFGQAARAPAGRGPFSPRTTDALIKAFEDEGNGITRGNKERVADELGLTKGQIQSWCQRERTKRGTLNAYAPP